MTFQVAPVPAASRARIDSMNDEYQEWIAMEAKEPDSMTLRDAYRRFLLPKLGQLTIGTLAKFEEAINHFEQRTHNPVVVRITNETIQQMRSSFLADGYGNDSINETGSRLRYILGRLGWAN